MHPMQARTGGLLVATGFTVALTLTAGWAVFIGPALLVAGGLMLALAAEPMIEEGTPATDVAERAESGGMAA